MNLRLIYSLLGALLGVLYASELTAQTTAFTYQGELSESGQPTGGEYDLVFSLHDMALEGSQLGASLTNTAVAVSGGRFTVRLDFGGGMFTGAERWLQISVRTNEGDGVFTTLSPRQALTPVPTALYAMTPAGPQGPIGLTGATGPTGASGSQGVQGDPGPQGPAGLLWQEGWSDATSYRINDAVLYGGSSYRGLIEPNLGSNPADSPAAWQLVARQGDIGPTGAQGDPGPAGPQGPRGASGPRGYPGQTGSQGPQGPPGSPAGGITVEARNIALLRWPHLNGTFATGPEPSAATFDGDSLWVVNAGDDTLSQLRDGLIVAVTPVERDAAQVVFDGVEIWVAGRNYVSVHGLVEGLSLESPSNMISDGKPDSRGEFGASVWVADFEGDIYRLRRKGSNIQKVYQVKAGHGQSGLAFDGTYLWVTCQDEDKLVQFQAETGEWIADFPTTRSPTAVICDGRHLWVTSELGALYVHSILDPNLGGEEFRYAGGAARRAATDGQVVWVAISDPVTGNSKVWGFRAVNGVSVGFYPVDDDPSDIVFDGASIWVTSRASNTVNRIWVK